MNSAFEQLREHVLASPVILKRLRATLDRETFVVETLHVAAEMNLKVTAAEIENALRTAREECIERWD